MHDTMTASRLWVIVALLLSTVAASSAPETEQQLKALQLSLSGSMSQSVNTVLETVGMNTMPAFEPTNGFTVDTDSCNEGGDRIGYNVLLGMSTGFMTFVRGVVGVQSADSLGLLVSRQASTMADAVDVLKNVDQANAGGGMGIGFTVFCGDEVAFSWGLGGGGGGYHQSSTFSGGWGAGGGGQAGGHDWGGGGSCDLTNLWCTQGTDTGSVPYLSDLSTYINRCSSFMVCVEGGGGFGIDTEGCNWGGGFSMSYHAVTAVRDPSLSRDNQTNTTRTADAIKAPLMSCSSASGGAGAGVAARICSVKCSVSSEPFNSCFCPCFKSQVSAAGLSWGNSITCST